MHPLGAVLLRPSRGVRDPFCGTEVNYQQLPKYWGGGGLGGSLLWTALSEVKSELHLHGQGAVFIARRDR